MDATTTAVYVLNSPVLTAFGEWVFEGPLSVDRAVSILKKGFTSAIGHESTAQFLSMLLGVDVPANRVSISMRPGDRALVFRLLVRFPEGAVLTREQLGNHSFELGLLTRVK